MHAKAGMGIGTAKATARRTYHTSVALATLLVPSLLACSGSAGLTGAQASELAPPAAAAPLAERPFFVPGETITWDVAFAGVQGGRARLAVGQVGSEQGRRLVVLRAEAEATGVLAVLKETRDTIASWVDVDSGLPARTESATTGVGKPIVVHAERVPGVPLVALQVWSPRTGDEGAHKEQRLPTPRTHDPLTILLALRAWEAPRGGRATAYSLGGVRVWKNVFTVEGREDVDSPLGRRAAIKIAGESRRITAQLEDDTSKPARTFTVWLSDDAQRIPLRFAAHTELGDVVAQATSYTVAD